MHVLGTAGHVDHGKSSLVRALTGTDPDRWIEEQLRGMTLDLGFAHLRFEDGVEAGIVDVPGHERFLHNMLAGAAGMELLLLVVAANDGPRPQTLEHLAILQYLNVKRTIVVLSKADTVDARELARAHDLVRDAVAGTLAEGAPIVPVSTLTGSGIGELRAAIHAALVSLPPRSPDAPAYLPVDRVFALRGHGTIVTGTLMQGRIAVGDRLMLTPLERETRVRSLQAFGEKRDVVEAGSRVAVNLPGIDAGDISRGAVLASGEFAARSTLAVSFRALPAALDIVKRRTPVRVYLGAAELLGTLVFDALPIDANVVAATLYLRTPAVAIPGAAFVVRRLSPKTLLGGGIVTSDALGASDDQNPGAPEERADSAVAAALRDAGLAGTSAARLAALANVREAVVDEILERFVRDGRAVNVQKPTAFVDGALAQDAIRRAVASLATSQANAPWIAGTMLAELAHSLAVPEPQLARLIGLAAAEGRLAYHGGKVATPDFIPKLSAEQEAFFERIITVAPEMQLSPVPFEVVQQALRASRIPGIAQAFETLLLGNVLVKIDENVYRGSQIAAARGKLEAALRRDSQITMTAFRDLLGTSRKLAVPLLEWFDASGVTLRSGDVRTLRTSPVARRVL